MTSFEKARALVDEVLSRRLFFVGGQGKSGTSWVQLILDSHPQIACSGEGHLADMLIPWLDRAYEEYGAFLRRNNALFPELEPYPSPAGEDTRHLARNAVALQLARQCGSSLPEVIAERTPANIEHLERLHSLFPQAGFVHVIRDVRDVAVSLWFHGLRTNPEWIKKEYGSLDSLAVRLAGAWSAAILRVRRLGAGVAYHEVRYESLKTDFDASVDALFRALGVDQGGGHIRTARQGSDFTRIAGRRPGEEDAHSHFRKGVVGDWREHLGTQAVAGVQRHAGDLLEEFGYDAG